VQPGGAHDRSAVERDEHGGAVRAEIEHVGEVDREHLGGNGRCVAGVCRAQQSPDLVVLAAARLANLTARGDIDRNLVHAPRR
jgi:hypothetical protein